jgi:hypothetical protein
MIGQARLSEDCATAGAGQIFSSFLHVVFKHAISGALAVDILTNRQHFQLCTSNWFLL